MWYYYKGDKQTDPKLKGVVCFAVRDNRGKCIRGRNGNMLVSYDYFPNGDCKPVTKTVVVLARHLRKIIGFGKQD